MDNIKLYELLFYLKKNVTKHDMATLLTSIFPVSSIKPAKLIPLTVT